MTNSNNPQMTNTYTYLALGDSYTCAQSVPSTESYPVQAVNILAAENIHFSGPEIIARTGWTTTDLLNKINSSPPKCSTYDIVTLLIGVNNQYQHLSELQYKTEFTILLNKAIQYANNKKKRVIVLSIPDYSIMPFAEGSDTTYIAQQINRFNGINQTMAQQAGVYYLDITAYTRMAAGNSSLVAYDGLHPSGKEYKIWATDLALLIRTALQ
ncbi:MAG TPA: GDSL-type esterase/lipase family protein [Ferruginibacter sp.]|nr:GDSL-type esterase/lipase family protein [Ferruginibacter sp.]